MRLGGVLSAIGEGFGPAGGVDPIGIGLRLGLALRSRVTVRTCLKAFGLNAEDDFVSSAVTLE